MSKGLKDLPEETYLGALDALNRMYALREGLVTVEELDAEDKKRDEARKAK